MLGDLNVDQNLSSFSVEYILDHSVTDFDLFLNVENQLVLYGNAGYEWRKSELERLLNQGIREFLIRIEDEPKAYIYREVAKIPGIERDLSPHDRIMSIEDVGTSFIRCAHEVGLTESVHAKAKQLASALVNCIQEDTSCVQALGSLSDHDYYTYAHSIRVSALTCGICYTLGMTDAELLMDVALGGIFHDIGKSRVPIEIINKAGALTEDEWAKMRSHPEKGHQQIQESQLSHTSLEIILHHHERVDGSGYPHGLSKGSLLTEVQVATTADIYDALTSSRAYQNKRSRFQALDLMKHQMVGSKISGEPFSALVSCLSIPGA